MAWLRPPRRGGPRRGQREALEPELALALVVAEQLERELVEVEHADPAEPRVVQQRQDVVAAEPHRLPDLAEPLAGRAVLGPDPHAGRIVLAEELEREQRARIEPG